ncbi:MAG: glutamate racemase [Chlamydiota bacterium]|nr:glutamate racemase [Chlamydiota bacterium]
MTNPQQPIGIFDSGIGGLTVLSEIRKACPNEHIIYFGDTARVPYGSKSARTITRFATEAILFLLSFQVKLIVCACNTVSALALPALQKQFKVPIINVIEPGVFGASQATRNNRIGVVGTRATIGSKIYEQYLHLKNPALLVHSIATPLLVPLVEEDWLDEPETASIITHYINPLIQEQIDVLILGCTHYPLLKEAFLKVAGPNIQLIDSAFWTAKTTKEALNRIAQTNEALQGKIDFYFSDHGESFSHQAQKFLDFPVNHIHNVVMEEGSYLIASERA